MSDIMSNIQVLRTAVKVKSALSAVGSNPMSSDEEGTVKGEDTDSLVTSVAVYWVGLFAVGAVASAGTYNTN